MSAMDDKLNELEGALTENGMPDDVVHDFAMLIRATGCDMDLARIAAPHLVQILAGMTESSVSVLRLVAEFINMVSASVSEVLELVAQRKEPNNER